MSVGTIRAHPGADQAVDEGLTDKLWRWGVAARPYSSVLVPGLAAFLEVTAYDPPTGLSLACLLPCILFVSLTGVWPPEGRRRLVPVRSFVGGVSFSALIGYLAGLPGLNALAVAVGSAVAAIVMAAVYRHGLANRTSWAPRRPGDLLWLFLGAAAAAFIAAILGASPYRRPFLLTVMDAISGTGPATISTADLVSVPILATRIFVWTGLGGLTVLMFWWHGVQRVLPRRALPLRLLPLVLGPSCLSVVYLSQDHPWLFLPLLASLVAGLIYTPYDATSYTVGVSLVAATCGIVVGGLTYDDPTLPDGALLDVVLTVSGYQTMLVVFFRDQFARVMCRLQQNEADARSQARLLDTIFQSMSDGMAIIDDRLNITMHNRAMRGLLRRPFPTRPPSSYARYFGLRRASTGEPIVDDEELGSHISNASPEVLVGEPGDERRISITTTPIIENTGSAIMLMRDITAEHALVEELRGFAGKVAHDLRSPLTSVVSWIEVASDELRDGDPEVARETIRRAAQAAIRMDGVIADWLAYTVSRKGVMQPVTLALQELVDDICTLATGAEGLSATVATPHTVYADPALTRQLVANIIGNAVKYRRPGQIPQVSVTSRPDADPTYVAISVADRGVGIPAGEEEAIFGEFTRSERDAAGYVGTGLGLALCRAIVHRHGGTISASTNADGGATFVFTLPAARH